MFTRRTYRIEGTKARTGEHVAGTTEWDGLAALYAVTCEDGQIRYLSVLDQITVFEPVGTR
jgi:hypothetical protein